MKANSLDFPPPPPASLQPVFIRRSPYRRSPHGTTYANFRLVQSVRIHGRPRQKTLLNLGAGFDLPAADWPRLCQLIETIATGRPLPPRAAPAAPMAFTECVEP